MGHIFISYSRQDIDFARYVRAMLENQGFWVWMDEKRLTVGMDWWDEIEANIDSCSAFVVIMSPESRKSVFVRNEILRAIDQNKALFPILYRGKHFGMLAHVQHEDMLTGLNASFSDEFIASLSNTVGLTTKRIVRVEVIHESVQNFETDVLIMKSASGSSGVDSYIKHRLKRSNKPLDETKLLEIGDYALIEASGTAILAKHIAFIKTAWVGAFGYRQVREFANRALTVIGTDLPETKHIAMTIHGVNTRLRLDEGESMLAQLAGLVDVLKAWDAPHALEKISIVERDIDRVGRIKEALQGYFDEVDYAQPATDVDWAYDLTFEREGDIEAPDAGADNIKPYAIVVFPEHPDLEDIFHYGIKRPIHAMGLLCERVNSAFADDNEDDIQASLARISNASRFICDISEITPLLYLQLGYAWGKNIPTVLITRNDEQVSLLGNIAPLAYQKIWELEERLGQWLKNPVNS